MSRDPGLPPARESSVRKKLESKLAALDQAWNEADDACNAALEMGTKEGDDWAQFYHDRCMAISKERSKVHDEMGERDYEKAARLAMQKARRGQGRRKTRRRMRGGAGDVWKVVGAVCEALGLKGSCALATPTEEQKKTVEITNPPRFEEWGPPPESPKEEMTFILPDQGRPPRHPPVQCRVPRSVEMRKEAFYLRDVAKEINAKGDKELARRFMVLAREAYAKSCATEKLEQNPINRVGILETAVGPVGTLKPGAKGGKTRRRGKSKK